MKIGTFFYLSLTSTLISYAGINAMAQKPEPPVRVKKLLNASFNGDAQEVQRIIDKNKKCNQPLLSLSDNDGNSALHRVCAIGYIVRKDGTSAGRAVYDKADYPQTLAILLKEGANKTERNIYNESASDILTKVDSLIEKKLSTLESSQESKIKLLQNDRLAITYLHELFQE
jgi:hypothetical protein